MRLKGKLIGCYANGRAMFCIEESVPALKIRELDTVSVIIPKDKGIMINGDVNYTIDNPALLNPNEDDGVLICETIENSNFE